jgi:hypothetical protein
MELLMNGLYLATVFAAFITVSIASRLFVVAALTPAAPGLLAGIRLRIGRLVGAVGDLCNDWVAAMLARRERQASMSRAARERLQ